MKLVAISIKLTAAAEIAYFGCLFSLLMSAGKMLHFKPIQLFSQLTLIPFAYKQIRKFARTAALVRANFNSGSLFFCP
jgi:hypothetical protein